jgi:hypothetical protein
MLTTAPEASSIDKSLAAAFQIAKANASLRLNSFPGREHGR